VIHAAPRKGDTEAIQQALKFSGTVPERPEPVNEIETPVGWIQPGILTKGLAPTRAMPPSRCGSQAAHVVRNYLIGRVDAARIGYGIMNL